MPANGFSVEPRKVKLLAGEPKATEFRKAAAMARQRQLLAGMASDGLSYESWEKVQARDLIGARNSQCGTAKSKGKPNFVS